MTLRNLVILKNLVTQRSFAGSLTSCLTGGDLGGLERGCLVGEVQPSAADLQHQALGLLGEAAGQQQAVGIPGAELEAHGEALQGGRRRRQGQEAAAGAQEGGGHQLGPRAGEGHVALEGGST